MSPINGNGTKRSAEYDRFQIIRGESTATEGDFFQSQRRANGGDVFEGGILFTKRAYPLVVFQGSEG